MQGIFLALFRIRTSACLKGIICALLIAITYRTALKQLIWHDWFREDYSHCAIIPLVILYLIWQKRFQMASVASSSSRLGLIPFLLGIGLYWLGEFGGEFFTVYLSLWFVAVGLLWMHMGWKKIKIMAFAIFIALTMFPFPNFINNKVLLKLKLISSQLGVAMLQMCGMSAYREGNVIDLGFTQLQVVDACSGLRYMLPLMVLSLVMAYWYRASFWKKAVLVVSTIPFSILVNSLRIALTGILCGAWGEAVAQGFFHGFSGWLIFMFTVPVLLMEMWLLDKIGKQGENARGGIAGETSVHTIADRTTEAKRLRKNTFQNGEKLGKAMLQPAFITAVVLLSATLALSHGIEFREKVPINKSFSRFPMTIGEWSGRHLAMEMKVIESLDLSDYLMAAYHDPKGKTVDFYVAYYESQRKGEGTHSPETCLPGSGWKFEQSGLQAIGAGDGRHLRVNRVLADHNGLKQLVYFWFPQRGRVLTSLYQVKLYTFWDALTRQRTDGALVRVTTQVYPDETMATAEDRMQEFTQGVVPLIDEYVPR